MKEIINKYYLLIEVGSGDYSYYNYEDITYLSETDIKLLKEFIQELKKRIYVKPLKTYLFSFYNYFEEYEIEELNEKDLSDYELNEDELEKVGKYKEGYDLFLEFLPNLDNLEISHIEYVKLITVTEEEKLF